MTAEDRLRRALSSWHDGGVPVDEPEASREREEKSVEMLERAIRSAPVRRERLRRRRIGAIILAAAALIAIAFGFGSIRRTVRVEAPARVATLTTDGLTAVVMRNGAPLVSAPGATLQLETGDEISVPAGGAGRVELGSGAHVKFETETRVRLSSESERDETLSLMRGSVEVEVPKLAAPRTLSVSTPHARVVVHGTRFSVRIEGEHADVTTVHVFEGEVAVLYEPGHVVLHGGEGWSSSKEKANAPASVPTTESESARPESSNGSLRPSRPALSEADTLAEQNRLYRSALDAARRGDDAGAVRLFSELLRRFPRSPLAGEAERQRAQVLRRSAPAAGSP